MLAASLLAGCTPDGPLGTVGAIVTAPITAPVMFVSARMNDREDPGMSGDSGIRTTVKGGKKPDQRAEQITATTAVG